MSLFLVNSVDYSSYVVQKSYSVQRSPVGTSWIDGNWVTHRVISRNQVTGSFNMTFTTEVDYTSFLSDIAAVKNANGYCPIQVWVNNDKELASINAFVDIKTIHRWTTAAFGGNPEIAAVTITITER